MKHVSKFLIIFALSSPLVAQVFNEAELKELIREIVVAEQIIPQKPLTKEAIQSAMREVLQEWSPPTPEPEPQPMPNDSIEIVEVGYRHVDMRWENTWPDMAPVMIQRSELGTFTDPQELEDNQSLQTFRWLGVNAERYNDLDNIKENTAYVYRVAAVLNIEDVRIRGSNPIYSDWLYGATKTGTLDSNKNRLYSVAAYGAIPDDGQNDYPAAEKAFHAAQAAGGGTVFFPEGDWDLWPDGPKETLFIVTANNITFEGVANKSKLTFYLSGKRPVTEWDTVDGKPKRHFVFLTNNCEDFTLRNLHFNMNARPVNTGKEWYSDDQIKYQWDTSHKLVASFDQRKFDRLLIEGITATDCRGEMIYNGGESGKILIKESNFARSNSSTLSGTFDLELVNSRISDSANSAVESNLRNGKNHIARGTHFIGLDTLANVPGKKNFGGWLCFNAEGTYQSVTDCTFEKFVAVTFGAWYECRNGFRFNCTFKSMSSSGAGSMFYNWTSRQDLYDLEGGFSNVLWLGDTIEVDRNWPNHKKFFYSQAQTGQPETPWRWVDVHFKKTGTDNYKINRIWEDQGGAAVRTNAVFYWWQADPGIRFDAYMLQKKPGNQYAQFIEFLD